MPAQSSSGVNGIDDLDSVNAFLARIGGSLVTRTEKSTPSTPPAPPAPTQNSPTNAPVTASGHGLDSKDESCGVDSGVTDWCLPSPTPVVVRAARVIPGLGHGQTLEDDLSALLAFAEEPQKGLKDSKHAIPALKEPASQKGFKVSRHAIHTLENSASQKNLSRHKKNGDCPGIVLKSIRASGHRLSPASSSSGRIEQEVPEKVSKADQPISSQGEDVASLSTGTEPFPALEKTEVQSFVGHYDPTADSKSQSHPTHGSQNLEGLLADEAKNAKYLEGTRSVLRSDGRTEAHDSATTSKYLTEAELDDGKHDKHVKALGNPTSPGTPKPASRKIILAGLPSNADHTLVASLLHGGTLESFDLFKSDADTTKHAAALFTEADAARKYCDMYPNGVQYNAILQGHLEAGASRLVRVTGADEDWSMRALCKLAGESNRKIESICDYWRKEVCTIDFMFTNISDAVHFRAQLQHDSEWQVCNIRFGFGLFVAWRLRKQTKGEFLSSNGTQKGVPLALNFIASGSGILFSYPQISTIAGVQGLIVYALSSSLPLLVFAFLGSIIRRKCPEGFVLTEWTRQRYGVITSLYLSALTLITLFLYMVAELSALQQIINALTGLNGLPAVIVECVVTSIYTSLGGFKVSFITDNVQGAMVVGLIIIGCITVGVETKVEHHLIEESGYLKASLLGWQLIYILPVAILTNDFFLSGFWMRTFAARTDRDLWVGVGLATIAVTIILTLVGVSGLLAGWSGALGDPPQQSSIAFFLLLEQLPAWVVGIVIVMTVSLSTAAFDSLQSAMVSTGSNDIFRNKLNFWFIRAAVILVIVPVVVVALKSPSVLQIYLISDLISASSIPCLVIGLSDRCWAWKGFEVVVGGLGGIFTVFLFGLVYYDGDATQAGNLILLEQGLYGNDWSAFGAFVAAPVGGLLWALAGFAARVGVQWVIAKVRRAPFTALEKPIGLYSNGGGVVVTVDPDRIGEAPHDVYTDEDGVERSTATTKGKFF
ncbi:hypothetical protein DV736_g2245, partial [Chaetothyriales sp. CBS 134916]